LFAIIVACIFVTSIPYKNMDIKPLSEAALEAEYEIIVEALKKTKFSKRKAAEILQIDRKTLYNRLDEYYKMVAKKEELAAKESIPGTY
jgi:DNA-binding NtrC family response regulator